MSGNNNVSSQDMTILRHVGAYILSHRGRNRAGQPLDGNAAKSKGVHLSYSGLSEYLDAKFFGFERVELVVVDKAGKETPRKRNVARMEWLDRMNGKYLELRPVKGGVMVYLMGEAPAAHLSAEQRQAQAVRKAKQVDESPEFQKALAALGRKNGHQS